MEERGRRRGSSPPSSSSPIPGVCGAGPVPAPCRLRRRRGCERCAPPCAHRCPLPPLPPPSPRSRPLSRFPSPRLPRSAAPLNPGSRPASRLALNNCLPPAKRPWGKYLLNGNNCPGSRGAPRLFRAYWFLAPALVNKPAWKRPPRAAPCPRPTVTGERNEMSGGAPGTGGGRLARPLRGPPAPLRPKLRLQPEGSPRRGPLRARRLSWGPLGSTPCSK